MNELYFYQRGEKLETLPIIISLNERPDKNPKELLNLLRENKYIF